MVEVKSLMRRASVNQKSAGMQSRDDELRVAGHVHAPLDSAEHSLALGDFEPSHLCPLSTAVLLVRRSRWNKSNDHYYLMAKILVSPPSKEEIHPHADSIDTVPGPVSVVLLFQLSGDDGISWRLDGTATTCRYHT